jgi:uncharacterized protein (TIGR02246 family)
MMKHLTALVVSLGISGSVMAGDAEQIVANANQEWNQALNGGKLQSLVSLYDEDATVSPGNGAVLRGHEEIAGLFGSFIDNGVHNHQIDTVQVLASEQQITQIANWKAQGVDENQQTTHFGGVLVTVLQPNADGEWQLQSHVWNMAP